jgi:hypothetical protein
LSLQAVYYKDSKKDFGLEAPTSGALDLSTKQAPIKVNTLIMPFVAALVPRSYRIKTFQYLATLALLADQLINPNQIPKRFEIGIVPHYKDREHPTMARIKKRPERHQNH